MPDGVVNLVCTDEPAPLVERILGEERVRKLSFTGSTAVGRRLLELCAPRVISASMELGGNSPFIVLHDADVDVAITGAMAAKMRNGGEACGRQPLPRPRVARERVHRSAHGGDGRRDRRRGARQGRPARTPDHRGGAREGRAPGRRRGRPRRARAHGRRAAARPRLLLPAHGARPGATGQRDPRRGGVRAGRAGDDVRDRGRGGRTRQRHRARPRGLRLQPRPAPRARDRRADRDGHGRPQPRRRLGPRGPVRRHQAERPRSRGRPPGLLEFLEPKYFAFD